MVQHLQESLGSLLDSTSNDNDGTNNGATYNASAKIDGGYDFDDSTEDYIDCGTGNSLVFGDGSSDDPFTFEAWINFTDATAQLIFGKYDLTTGSIKREYRYYAS